MTSSKQCPCCSDTLGVAVTNTKLISHDETCSQCQSYEKKNGTPLSKRASDQVKTYLRRIEKRAKAP